MSEVRGTFALLIALSAATAVHTGCHPVVRAPEAGPKEIRESVRPTSGPVIESPPDVKLPGDLADIHFDFDKAEIRADAKPILEKNAALLVRYPEVHIVVEGHCDDRGSVEYNLALGERRARATRDYLARLGVDPGRMSTVSYGKEFPLDPGHDELAWAKNRRAHLVAVK